MTTAIARPQGQQPQLAQLAHEMGMEIMVRSNALAREALNLYADARAFNELITESLRREKAG